MKTYVFGAVHLCAPLASAPGDRWLVEEISRRCETADEAMWFMRAWNDEGGGIERLCGEKPIPTHVYWLKRVESDRDE